MTFLYIQIHISPDPGINTENLVLLQNFPNPFNPSTNVVVDFPSEGNAELYVYDLLGNRISEVYRGIINTGQQSFTFTPENISSGMYLLQLRFTDKMGKSMSKTVKMTYLG